MSVEIYRWDALQSDGKSDGKNVALSSRRKFAVRSIFELTVNLECEVQHPCGFPGDRRIGRADGKFPRSQAIGGHWWVHASWLRAEQGNARAGDETTCPSLMYGTEVTPILRTLSMMRTERSDVTEARSRDAHSSPQQSLGGLLNFSRSFADPLHGRL
jgi:hypothetical protein